MTPKERRATSPSSAPYVPALGVRWLTRFYDPVLRLTLREEEFKRRLIAQTRIAAGHDVLDLGCGTGTLTIMVKRACPDARVTGLDGDPDVLAIAREKIRAADVAVALCDGVAFDLPFPPASFDRVVSSLVFHHLSTSDKGRTLAEIHRVLRPGGELHLADWGRPQNALMQVASLGIRMLDGYETTRANLEGRLPQLMREAGFEDVREANRTMTLFGTLSLYEGHVA